MELRLNEDNNTVYLSKAELGSAVLRANLLNVYKMRVASDFTDEDVIAVLNVVANVHNIHDHPVGCSLMVVGRSRVGVPLWACDLAIKLKPGQYLEYYESILVSTRAIRAVHDYAVIMFGGAVDRLLEEEETAPAIPSN